jgi:hypothetical protein
MDIRLRNTIKNIIYKAITEDFDFGKIKSKRIEDDYTISKSIIRKNLENIKVDKLFIDLYGDRGPTGLNSEYHINGFGNVVCRGHSLDNLTQYNIDARLLLRTVNFVRTSDLEDLGTKYKFKYVEYASDYWLEHHQQTIGNTKPMPDYLVELLQGLGVDTQMYNCKLICYVSPDEGICIIEKSTICKCLWGPDRLKMSLQIPSMMFFTGNVLYEINKKNVKKIEDNKKWLKKTDTFFYTAKIGQSYIHRI